MRSPSCGYGVALLATDEEDGCSPVDEKTVSEGTRTSDATSEKDEEIRSGQ